MVSLEDLAEMMSDAPFDLSPFRHAAQPGERSHAPISYSTWNDQVKMAEVRRMVERESVAGNPAGNSDANRRKLFPANPHAGETGDSTGLDAAVARDANEHLLEIADVSVHITSVGLQVDDGIAHDLPGTVIGDVATAT